MNITAVSQQHRERVYVTVLADRYRSAAADPDYAAR
jgi:hypothetical protein